MRDMLFLTIVSLWYVDRPACLNERLIVFLGIRWEIFHCFTLDFDFIGNADVRRINATYNHLPAVVPE